MNSLIIESTEISPKIEFDIDKNYYELAGESRPENVRKFYEPIISWLEEFGEFANNGTLKGPFVFNFKFEYFNSSSAKFIMDILKSLESISQEGADLSIKWYYDEGDEDMQETGEEFSKIIEIPFEYIEVED